MNCWKWRRPYDKAYKTFLNRALKGAAPHFTHTSAAGDYEQGGAENSMRTIQVPCSLWKVMRSPVRSASPALC